MSKDKVGFEEGYNEAKNIYGNKILELEHKLQLAKLIIEKQDKVISLQEEQVENAKKVAEETVRDAVSAIRAVREVASAQYVMEEELPGG